MKCGIITFHRAINYGGVLQCYALQQAIKKQGVEAEVIDYYCPSLENLYRPKGKTFFCKANFKRIASVLLKNGTLRFNNYGFAKFRDRFLTTSEKKYYSHEDLKTAQYDRYITGSDQVWSYYCAGFDPAYFLDFVDDGTKKNAYAASYGVGEIPEELRPRYYELLKDFNHITVREEDGAKITESVLGKKVDVVPDPTMLLNKEEWTQLLPETRTIAGKYILVYMISEDQQIIDDALELSAKTGLKVYYINDRFYKKPKVVNLRKVSPQQWVDLFMHAEYVFTNSFHGVAFSLNFGRNLFVRRLNRNVKVNSRIENILNRFGISDCLTATEPLSTDCAEIKEILEQERALGIGALSKILSR